MLSDITQPTAFTQTRNTLFGGSRDLMSMKHNVPLSKVREMLSNSGKNSTNSFHFDIRKAQYFRADAPRFGNRMNQAASSMTSDLHLTMAPTP